MERNRITDLVAPGFISPILEMQKEKKNASIAKQPVPQDQLFHIPGIHLDNKINRKDKVTFSASSGWSAKP